jgi:hypothetical protein
MDLRDWAELAPVQYRVRPRLRSEIRAEVMHQTGFEWRPGNPMWAKVRAHFVVHRCGLVTQLHAITERMRYGCGVGNAWAINVEHEGNYPLDYKPDGTPVFWRPEKYGRSVLADAPAQVEAGRQLLAWLAEKVPGLMVGCHRQVQVEKSGCCGPDLWREIGQHAVDAGMPELPTAGGRPIPDEWRGSTIGRPYTGPLSV